MPQTRIVLKDPQRDIAQQIQDVTGLGNLTEVIGAMLTRYGKHMLDTWEVDASRCPDPAPVVESVPSFSAAPPTDSGASLPALEL